MLTLTCNVGSFQKPAELKEESRHDGEQKGEHMNHVQKRSQIMFLKQGREDKNLHPNSQKTYRVIIIIIREM